MKHILLFAVSICCSLILLEVKAQEREQKSAIQTPSPGGTTATAMLRDWVGKWDVVVAYVESGGQYTASWSSAKVTQPTINTIVFTVWQPAGGPLFDCNLKHDGKSGNYLLTVESRRHETIQDLELRFTPESGFVGAGTFKNVAVNASITRTEKGYKVSVTDPKLPERNNKIFGVEFVERK